MDVTRNPDGSHQPPYNPEWPPHLQLEWVAGVAAEETGLRINVINLGDDKYALHVGSSGQSPMSLSDAYAFLDGVQTGAREARR
ncbi:hypothetical protein ACH4F6_37695 [Streptomyces sp. NPDC017936]|uniref:hypothetical protein n=1 Tax=Streptomyces sp. NPDC017936 TaxID=3365016 RepID=UPI003790FD0E